VDGAPKVFHHFYASFLNIFKPSKLINFQKSNNFSFLMF